MTLLPPTVPKSSAYRSVSAPDVERLAKEFAACDAASAETMIDALAKQAIARWQLDDAIVWQRVKFRSRLLRAARRES